MIEDEFKRIALDLDVLQLDPRARLYYEVMSDSLMWSDELPKERLPRELWCMRAIFRYRTGLILGIEEVELRTSWLTAKSVFPKWIGFIKERCQRNTSLEELYKKLSKKG